MLYLTESNLVPVTVPVVYSTWVEFPTKQVHARTAVLGENYRTCIIDIDEHLACILTLKGVPLSKIDRVYRARMFRAGGEKWPFMAKLADIESLYSWW